MSANNNNNNNNNNRNFVRADMQHVKDIPESQKGPNPFLNDSTHNHNNTTCTNVPLHANHADPKIQQGRALNQPQNNASGQKLDLNKAQNCSGDNCDNQRR